MFLRDASSCLRISTVLGDLAPHYLAIYGCAAVPRPEVACVSDVRAGHCTHLRRRHRGQRRRVAIQGQKLHLEGCTVPMDVNNRADIARLQGPVGNVLREHDAIMFFQRPASSADAR